MEELFHPLEAYRDRLKEEHARNVSETFEKLVAEAGTDAEGNRKTCEELKKLREELKAAKGSLAWRRFWRGLLWVLAVAAGVGVWLAVASGGEARTAAAAAGGGVLALAVLLALKVAGPAVARAKERVEELAQLAAEKEAEAEAQVAGLMKLFDWDLPGKISEKTMPQVKFDPFFTGGRLRELESTFGWRGEGIGEGSVLWSQSGEINGNPFVVGRVLEQGEGMETYTGHLWITYRVPVRDANGHVRMETRRQRLTATVTKPKPVYGERDFVIYANEAAERLAFRREPSPMAETEPGSRAEKRALKGAVKKLEKFARNLDDSYGFTMSDPEFEAYFNAWDRSDEVQFRLLFTPLAQRQELSILKDRTEGFGDDFEMQKTGKINVLWPEHLKATSLDGEPGRYHSCDLREIRRIFQEYNEGWFRHVFFALAPLLAVPLYQQYRSHETIWKCLQDRASASPEHEALANYLGEGHFRHPASVTRNILKTAARRGAAEQEQRVEVTAYGFRTETHTDYVATWGADGKVHEVPVEWKEYLPVSRRSEMDVVDAEGLPRREFEGAASEAWGGFLRRHRAMAGEMRLRRGVLGGRVEGREERG